MARGGLAIGWFLNTGKASFLGGMREWTYYMACFQVSPSKLFTAAPMLKTRERNQKQFTELATELCSSSNENWRVVAVTAEKKVATVERLRRLEAPCFCANLIVGTPMKHQYGSSTR